jgi:thiamine-phosphate pyrophosphorylase
MERLLYISQATSDASHLDNIRAACEAGCRWIQLRAKSGDISAQAMAAKIICDQFGARLSINDHPAVAAVIQSYGTHVGLQDTPLPEARRLAGAGAWLGGTANTPHDALAHASAGADYIGYGPYRFTSTKEKLSPVLGIEGYHQLMATLKAKNISIPVLAIGGILLEDIPALMASGIHGIAVSGLITHAANKKEMVNNIKLALSCSN